MLDIRLDQRPLTFPPPPPLLPVFKDQRGGEVVGGYLDAASVLNRFADPLGRLPDPMIPILLPGQQQGRGSHNVMRSPLVPLPLEHPSEPSRIRDPAAALVAAAASRISGVDNNMSSRHTLDHVSIPTAFHLPYHSQTTGKVGHHNHHHHHHHQQQLHHEGLSSNALSSRLIATAANSSVLSSFTPSSPTSSLPSPLSSRSGHRLGQSRAFQRHRDHRHGDRSSSTSPGFPWRPLPSKPKALPALMSPVFQDQAFRGAESVWGEQLSGEPSDRALYGALSSLPWPFSPSVQMAMASDGSVASSLARFAPASSFMDSSSSGLLLDPLLFAAPGFMIRHLPHPDLIELKDAFCRASSPRLDLRSSPGKELPSKVKKQNRVKDRQEVTSVLEADFAASERLANIKKTTSTQTQTQLSGFPNEGLPPPPYHTTHDTIKLDRLNTSMAPLPSPSYHHHHHVLPPSSFVRPGFHPGALPPLPPPPPLPPLPPLSLHPTSLSSPTSTSSPSSSSSPTTPTHKSKIPKAPPLYANRSPPPEYAVVARTPTDVQHAPLNLSLSGQAPPPSSPTTPTHPSVISCGSVAPPMDNVALDQGGATDWDMPHSHNKFSNRLKAENHEVVSQDEALEEHFRRSLGQKYTEASSPKQTKKTGQSPQVTISLAPAASTVSQATETSDTEGVSITGSVDDHFARALGNQMWTAIKAKSEPSTPEVVPDTVDAHFAKALGASMWKKIKAEAGEAETDAMEPQQPLHHHHLNHHHHPHHPTQQQQQHQRRPSSSSPIHSRQVAT